MSDSLFRMEAVEARRQRLTGTVIAAVPPRSHVYTGLLGAVCVVLILFAVFGSYAGSATARGTVAFDKGIARVFVPSPGEVRRISVKVGDEVAAGQPLVTLSMAQGERGLAAQIDDLDRQIAEVDRQLTLARDSEGVGSQALRQQQATLQDTVASLDKQLSIARDQVALANATVGRRQRLAKQGAGSQAQVEDARRDLLSRQAEVEGLEERLSVNRNAQVAIGVTFAQAHLDAGKAASQLRVQRAALTAQRAGLIRADHLVIAAPVAGRVGDVSTEVGQRATTEQPLVTIVPADSKLEVRLFAPSSAVGFVRPGQRVRLRFDAFPYQKYGWGTGTVASVSQVAVDPSASDSAAKPAEPVFRVRVRGVSLRGMTVPGAGLRPGMTLTADLIQRPRPLWALLLGPVASGGRS